MLATPVKAATKSCGFCAVEMCSETAVHFLERGAVWITTGFGRGEGRVRALRGSVGRLDEVVVSRMPGQGSPIIAAAWAYQFGLTVIGDGRLVPFVYEFEGSFDAPEPAGRCGDGLGNPTF